MEFSVCPVAVDDSGIMGSTWYPPLAAPQADPPGEDVGSRGEQIRIKRACPPLVDLTAGFLQNSRWEG